jgi:HSP20 family protein
MLLRRVWPSRPAFESAFADFDQLRREIMGVFDSVTGTGDQWRGLSAGVFPPLNVTQDNDHIYVRTQVPGVRTSDLSISALRNRVTISGKREIPEESPNVSYHRKERAQGEFSRTITLPGEVDTDKIDARCIDGILTLKLPKAAAAKPRQITVSA